MHEEWVTGKAEGYLAFVVKNNIFFKKRPKGLLEKDGFGEAGHPGFYG